MLHVAGTWLALGSVMRLFFLCVIPFGYFTITLASIWYQKAAPDGFTAASRVVKALVDSVDIPFKLMLWMKLEKLVMRRVSTSGAAAV
jgi:hypothetical protein